MNRLVLTILLLLLASAGFARHLKGGFFTYTYLSKTATSVRYHVTLTVYMECNASGGQLDESVNFTFYDASTGQLYVNQNVQMTQQYELSKGTDEQCITGDQRECYYKIVVYDLNTIDLPINAKGYTVSYQRCCRIEGINNIQGSGEIGNTYSIQIPGTTTIPSGQSNSSARFLINDTVVICGGSEFEYPFVAVDPDNDRLSYEFCDAWIGGSTIDPGPTQAGGPPYGVVPYQTGFFGGAPLGSAVTIDPNTGIIKGVAPSIPGEYVVTVCVSEYRGNTLVGTTRKEIHIKIGNCVPIMASLNPEYVNCDGYTLTFQNNAASNDIQTYFWDFGDFTVSTDTSNLPVAPYTYPDTGVYTIKLVVNRGLACSDSTTALAKVFPGFTPDFSFAGVCVNKPTEFTDRTTAAHGSVNSWAWDFGVSTINTDVSADRNPAYTFSNIADYSVRLIATSSKGCRDTVFKTVPIIDRPPLDVSFRDTLICNGDALQLEAIGNGSFTWTPAGSDIVNENTATPTVTPANTKKYFVQLDDNGCLNQDSVQVRVVDFVTLRARGDTVICATDNVQLSAESDGLQFTWAPDATIDNPNIINPIATPGTTTTYTITATIGHCTASDNVLVTLVPYPEVNAGPDVVICYDSQTQLTGSMNGTSFAWSPTTSLTGANTLSPFASPLTSTPYVLTVLDASSGCPKPSFDTVVVNVLPKINPFAGRDTSVVVGQPLQFTASGGVDYEWFPASSLDNPKIATPVAVYDGNLETIRYKVHVYNEASCVDSAFITVKIFKTAPQVFVPTAFTPNSDGRNDVIRPIAVGISKIEYFRVFNRWGELVFSTNVNGQGWDGKIGGKDQGSGTFVWLVKGLDYSGKVFFAKGTATLIR